MRITLIVLFTLFFQKLLLAQSPFNYGQNKKTYFISESLREKLAIKSIYTVRQSLEFQEKKNEWEYWDVTLISFDTNSITDNWYPISLDTSYKYNFDSLTTNLTFLNGKIYEFSDGQLIAYGGYGHGSFDCHEVIRPYDTISMITSFCCGNCGTNSSVSHSKNVFNKNKVLLYSVKYPTPVEDEELAYYDMTPAEYEKYLLSGITSENLPDTTFFNYTNGLLSNQEFSFDGEYPDDKFHQCYVGNIEMEKYFIKKLGYIPELILIEIYRYGVFSFTLNAKDKKYYQTNTIILEQ